jgi:hypothetical protein
MANLLVIVNPDEMPQASTDDFLLPNHPTLDKKKRQACQKKFEDAWRR